MSAPQTHSNMTGHKKANTSRALAYGVLALFAVGFLVPSLVYAAPKSFAELVYIIIDVINPLVGLLMSCAVLFFFFSVIRYMSTSSEEAKGKFKENIVWSIIGLFVLVSFFGLARILHNTLLGGAYSNPYPESGTRQF